MDQRTKKLSTMHKALHPRDDIDRQKYKNTLKNEEKDIVYNF